jgi:hypothetical protein
MGYEGGDNVRTRWGLQGGNRDWKVVYTNSLGDPMASAEAERAGSKSRISATVHMGDH